MSRLFQQLLFRYRGLHLLLLLIFSLLLQFLYYDREMPFLPQWVGTIIVVALCTLAAWFAAARLTPFLLYKKRKAAFVFSLLGLALINSVIIYFVAGFVYSRLTGKEMFPNALYFIYIISFFFTSNIIVIAIACALRILKDRFNLEDRLLHIEQENIRTELAYLKAQVNPHFLFNVLNTIYFQINRSNVAARNSVERFSELLRYQLYECNTDTVAIESEISNLHHYISLQQLRLEAGTKIIFTVQPDMPYFQLAPLLLLPFVENAFKHISHFKNQEENKVTIDLYSPKEGLFVLEIKNTFNEQEATVHLVTTGGLGLQNVRRRLALLYPRKHQLDTQTEDNLFKIKLQLVYNDAMPFSG